MFLIEGTYYCGSRVVWILACPFSLCAAVPDGLVFFFEDVEKQQQKQQQQQPPQQQQ